MRDSKRFGRFGVGTSTQLGEQAFPLRALVFSSGPAAAKLINHARGPARRRHRTCFGSFSHPMEVP